jgi:hypothetical protein
MELRKIWKKLNLANSHNNQGPENHQIFNLAVTQSHQNLTVNPAIFPTGSGSSHHVMCSNRPVLKF